MFPGEWVEPYWRTGSIPLDSPKVRPYKLLDCELSFTGKIHQSPKRFNEKVHSVRYKFLFRQRMIGAQLLFQIVKGLSHLPEQEPKHRRISFRVAEGQELEGVHVSPSPRENTIADVIIQPVAQAGFYQKETGKWLYFKSDEIPQKSKLAELGLDVERGVELIVGRDEDLPSLLKSLEDKGIRIEAKGEKDWPESVKQGAKVAVLGGLRIDRSIYRALCKIAFNYLRFIVGHNFVLHEDFNPIRRFIRYDEGQSAHFFSTGTQPILYDEAHYGVKLTEGHLIVVEWRGTNLICILRLFNMFTYLVVLCRTFIGIWIPIASDHHFDPETKKVSELLKVSKNLMPN